MPDPVIGGSSPGSDCAPIDGPYLLATADSRLTDATVFAGVIVAAASAPTDTRTLWRDTSASPPALKFFDGSTWTAFSLTGPPGPTGPGPWSLLTADFTAGAVGAGGLTATVAQTGGFAPGACVIIADITGAQAFYRVTASPSIVVASSVTLTRVAATPSASPDYVFAVANAALVSISGIALGASSGGDLEPVVVDLTDTPDFVFACGDIVTSPPRPSATPP